MEDAKEYHLSVFLFGNNELLHNIFLVPFVRHVHIQNNVNEFLFRVRAAFLFYKKDQRRHHNRVDKEHRDKRYGDVDY